MAAARTRARTLGTATKSTWLSSTADPFRKSLEMDVIVLAEKTRQLEHVFGKTAHRQG